MSPTYGRVTESACPTFCGSRLENLHSLLEKKTIQSCFRACSHSLRSASRHVVFTSVNWSKRLLGMRDDGFVKQRRPTQITQMGA